MLGLVFREEPENTAHRFSFMRRTGTFSSPVYESVIAKGYDDESGGIGMNCKFMFFAVEFKV